MEATAEQSPAPPTSTVQSQSLKEKKGGYSRAFIVMIGLFKLFKACLLVLAVVAVLGLTRPSVDERMRDWASDFAVGPFHHRIGLWLSNSVLRLDHKDLVGIAIIGLLYAGLFITEGVGLLMDKLWAEWLAVISTAGLIIPEIIEVHRRPTALRIGTVIVNLAIAIYLAFRVRARTRQAKAQGA